MVTRDPDPSAAASVWMCPRSLTHTTGKLITKWLWVKTNGAVLVGSCTTYFSGDWDVHWYDLALRPMAK